MFIRKLMIVAVFILVALLTKSSATYTAIAAIDDPVRTKIIQDQKQKPIKKFYQASAEDVSIIDLPQMNFLMIDGEGDPNTSQVFKDAVGALYSTSFTLRSIVLREMPGKEYTVMPLEGLWWTKDKTEFDFDDKQNLVWTIMLLQPDFVTEELLKKAIEQVRKNRKLPALENMRLETFNEGRAAQILHIGPYSAEPPTIKKLHKFILDKGFKPRGLHHEIYFGNPQTTAPEKLKTIIRQPIE